ncbi:hypothetical protein [Pseudomonas chlororaphis]
MRLVLDLNEHQLDTLHDFRKLLEQQRGMPASTPALELQRNYSALSTAAQIIAEAVDRAAQAQEL